MSPIQSLLESPPLPLPLLIPIASLTVLLVYLSLLTIYNLTLHPLSKIPGPLFARITPFYPLYLYYHGDFTLSMRRLHRQHGPFVRLAPNHVAIGASGAQKQLWTSKAFAKGDFYDAFAHKISRHRDLFSIRASAEHSQRKRISAGVWSMTSVLEMEAYVDGVVAQFMAKMGRLADAGERMDVGLWTWRFTYDVIGELFFGRAYGFLEQEKDIDGLMAAAAAVAPYEALIGMAPSWFRPFMGALRAIPEISRGVASMGKVVMKSREVVGERMAAVRDQTQTRSDMLGKMLNIVEEKGEKYDWTVDDVQQECMVPMVAGTDTVAITLTSILYHLAANPSSLARLQRDLDDATADGKLSPSIRYNEAVALPYLDAVISEGFRIHTLFGYPVPRVVPSGGAEICGRWWPEGTVLGTSSGVPEMNQDVFGEDPESWRPERWLVDRETHAKMWSDVFAFGTGQRACIGQHIARCEIAKIVPQFLREFNIEATSEWNCLERWFNKPLDCFVRVTRRSVV